MKRKTICLNMIVKNEKPVIKRCLESVKNVIDYWVIVDTGSTDGTQEVIQEYLKDIPGELHQRPWVNFGHNRNEALVLAKGKADYVLFIDADDRLVFSEDFVMPELEEEGYAIIQRQTSGAVHLEHAIVFMIKNDSDYKWEGVIHEYLTRDTEKNIPFPLFTNVFNEYLHDGHRSKDPQSIHKDIALLKAAIQNEPTNPRHALCLARTYLQQSNYKAALKCFKKMINIKGHPLEVYYSLLNIAVCQRMLNYDPEIFIKSFCIAHSYRPSRAEALYELALYYTDTKNYLMGYILSKIVMSIPMTTDYLFVAPWVYDWGGSLLFFISSNGIGALEESLATLEDLLKKNTIPEAIYQHFKLKECHKELTESLSKLSA